MFPSQITATSHGKPNPKKTLTELDPVTLPTAESAYFSAYAAAILAKVSGSEVPKATIVIAVMPASIRRIHPKSVANSATIAVTIPIITKEMKKHG